MLSTPQSNVSLQTTSHTSLMLDGNDTKTEKTIFLTFDDGPLRGTENILHVLQKEKVPATMFMVGKHIKMNQALYQASLASPYVTVANHTYSHAKGKYRKFYSDVAKLLQDIQKADQLITKENQSTINSPFLPLRLAGRNVFRLPCISCDDPFLSKKVCEKEHSKYNTLSNAGFFIYGWDLEWGYDAEDGKPISSAKEIVNRLENIYMTKSAKQPNKVILLMHDFMFCNDFDGESTLHTLITLLKKSGWKFSGIDSYI